MPIQTAKTIDSGELPAAKKVQRMSYLDNLRLLFTLLVIVHHICLTYTGERGWYCYEIINDPFTNLVMVLLMTTGRNWVLQFFFLLSGYFTPGSLDRKGLQVYIKERLIHIGIPLAIFWFLIRPILYYITNKNKLPYSFLEGLFTLKLASPGQAWFLEVLLIFSVIYGLLWYVRKPRTGPERKEMPFPSTGAIFLFICGLSIITFIIRMFLPGDMQVLYLRLGNYADYIAFFALGIVGYRNKWLDKLSDRTGLQWTLITAAAFIVYCAFVTNSWASHESLAYLRGGSSVKTFITTWLGTHIAIGISISFTYLFRKFVNFKSALLKAMAAEAYPVFIFHAPVVIAVTYAVHDLASWPFLKFSSNFVLSTAICFLVCRYVVRKIPYVNKVV